MIRSSELTIRFSIENISGCLRYLHRKHFRVLVALSANKETHLHSSSTLASNIVRKFRRLLVQNRQNSDPRRLIVSQASILQYGEQWYASLCVLHGSPSWRNTYLKAWLKRLLNGSVLEVPVAPCPTTTNCSENATRRVSGVSTVSTETFPKISQRNSPGQQPKTEAT